MDSFTRKDKVYKVASMGGWELPMQDNTMGFEFSWDAVGAALAPVTNKVQDSITSAATKQVSSLTSKAMGEVDAFLGLNKSSTLPPLAPDQVPNIISRTVDLPVQYQTMTRTEESGGMDSKTMMYIGAGVGGFMLLMMMMMMMRRPA